MSIIGEAKKKAFPKGIKRSLKSNWNKYFQRTSLDEMATAFTQLGVPDEAVLCIHSSLNDLGYIVGGPQNVLRAVQKAVPGCTIIMPTFPFTASTLAYVRSNTTPFDPKHTPSRSGMLSEALRQMPEALRSMHPTHSCAAIGSEAEKLLEGSEQSDTPFGSSSAYGRFCGEKNAYLLLINTNNASIVHYIQEQVEMPNLFLEQTETVEGFDLEGNIKSYTIKIHRPKLPLYVAMEGEEKDIPQFVWFPDYSLLFPETKKQKILQNIRARRSRELLIKRHQEFKEDGIYRYTQIKNCEIMVVKLKPWIERINRDVLNSICNFSNKYELSYLEKVIQ